MTIFTNELVTDIARDGLWFRGLAIHAHN